MKYAVGVISLVVLVFVVFLVKDWGKCSFTEEYATERVIRSLSKFQNSKHLSNPNFIEGDCSYNYLYKDESNEISYVFTKWGEVHKWDHARDQ